MQLRMPMQQRMPVQRRRYPKYLEPKAPVTDGKPGAPILNPKK